MKRFLFVMIIGLLAGNCWAMTTEEWLHCLKQASKAQQRGDYTTAIDWKLKMATDNYEVPVNIASDYVALCLLYRCTGNDYKAKECLNSAIHIIRNNYGKNSEQRAVQLLRNFDRIPRNLKYADLQEIECCVMEMPQAIFDKQSAKLKARYDAIIGMMDAEIRRNNVQSRIFEMNAKFYAGTEYLQSTGRTFDPSNPPEYGTSAREKWETCKKIYDIFK